MTNMVKYSIAYTILLAIGSISISALAARVKPNILFIMTDDHAAHAIGSYGGRFDRLNPTPTIDKLANEGTIFTNAFVTNSICTPSRATILTGQYSQTNGVLDLDGNLPRERQTLAIEMSKAGYETALIGKWHLKSEPSAFDYYKVLKSQGTYFDPLFRIRGPKKWGENTVNYRGHSSDVVANQGIAWLRNRKDKRPFFLMLQFKAPHDMFEYAPRYEYYLSDIDIPEPEDLYKRHALFGSVATRGIDDTLVPHIGTSVSKRNVRRNMGQHMQVDPKLPSMQYTHHAYQRYLKRYLRCVKGVDDNISRVIDTLKKQGVYDDTVIIYTSDQGMMLGEHDYIDKRWMFDESMRMPLIVRHPQLALQPKTSDILINNTDFAPFMLDIAHARPPKTMQGNSFLQALSGKEIKGWRTASYYRYWMHRAHHDVPAHFGVRTKKYKLIFYYGSHYAQVTPPYYDKNYTYPNGKSPIETKTPPAWEFYDLSKDPKELINRYDDASYRDIIVVLKKELKAQRVEYNETDNQYPGLKKIINASWHL